MQFAAWLILNLALASTADYLHDNFPAAVIEDVTLDTTQLLRKYNYPAETHYTTTEDGYVLCLHRIARPGAKPVLLMHGLGDSSSGWVLLGPNASLGYFLYDANYDVWMASARGTRYSRNHTRLNPDVDKAYWSFSWHEIGFYDLPTLIDYILTTTAQPKLGYFGHSQGTTVFFVLASMRPEYNAKITRMHALAPVVFMKHIRTPLMRLKNFIPMGAAVLREILPHSYLLFHACFASKMAEDTCIEFIWQLMGRNPQGINMTMLPVFLGHVPAGFSIKQPQHYIQLVSSDRFCLFDYGPRDNLKHYGRPQPPDYPLERISAPVALYYASNDLLTSPVDVQRLAKVLPNVVEDNPLPNRKWNHLDMVFSWGAREELHERMVASLRDYE